MDRFNLSFILCSKVFKNVWRISRGSDIFSPDYMWNSKVKIWIWARSVKPDDLSDRPTCLSACIITGSPEGAHITSLFHSPKPLRMHKAPPDVTQAGAWNNLKHHRDCCHYIGHSCNGLHYQDCCRDAPGHHQPPSWLEYGHDGATDMLQPIYKECSREVVKKSTPNRHPTCREMKWLRVYKTHFISCRLQSTNNIRFQKSYCPAETIRDTAGTGNKAYKTNLVMKYKWHEYVILPYRYTIRPYLWLHWDV